MGFNDIARKYIGIREGTTAHHAIIDYYNTNIRPLPRGYKVKYSDPWCAVFASVIMKMGGGVNCPFECGVPQMASKAKQYNEIVSSPSVGDFIIYDWKNNGTLDHVGIIDSISGGKLKVIEGNYSDSVKVRTISTSSNEIECYFRVPIKNTVSIALNTSNIDKVVNDVIRGKYGNGTARKKNLENAGYNYAQIQSLVNAKLKG